MPGRDALGAIKVILCDLLNSSEGSWGINLWGTVQSNVNRSQKEKEGRPHAQTQHCRQDCPQCDFAEHQAAFLQSRESKENDKEFARQA